ncbi:MAG: response regulator, partial [Cyclobacteriaceae bacterium]|nr:response regulator [Cyclobacteriaceae bacterium]
QNWDIAQDTLGRIWVANSSTVLLFNGVHWASVEGTENKGIRNFVQTTNKVLYSGGDNTIGYFTHDARGYPIYASMMHLFPEENREIGTVRSMATNGAAVFYKTNDLLIKYENDSVKNWEVKSNHNSLSHVRDGILFQNDQFDILLLKDDRIDTLFKFNNQEAFSIIKAFDFSPEGYILFSQKSGIYQLSGNRLKKFHTQIEDILRDVEIEEVKESGNYDYALATKGAGIIFLDRQGSLIKQINIRKGLQSNTCYNLFFDMQDGWWLCLDNGISRIEYPSALTYYDVTNDLEGIVLTTLNTTDILYAGTTNGLFYIRPEEYENFKRIENVGEVWDIKSIDNQIWVASSDGIYLISNTAATRISGVKARTVAASHRSGLVWVGLEKGFGWFLLSGKSWKWHESGIQVNHQIRTIAQENDSVLWVSDDSLSRMVFDEDRNRVTRLKTFDESNGLSKDFWIIESYIVNQKLLLGSPRGLFRYDEINDFFVPDTAYGKIFTDRGRDAYALAKDEKGQLWLTSSRASGPLIQDENEVYHWDTLGLTRLKNTDTWRIVPDSNGVVWFCTTDGLYRYDTGVKPPYDKKYSTLINQVELNGDSVVFYNCNILEKPSGKSMHLPGLDYSHNSLRFSFSSTSYNVGENLQYSYKLEGYDRQWSDWVNESIKEYTGLPPKTYEFKIKSKNRYNIETEESSFSFSILPPWYRTWWAYGLYGLAGIGLIFAVDRIQRKRLFIKQQAKILMQEKELEREREISNKLRRVDKLKDEFLAHTSHELRTPLHGIIGISESLQDQIDKMDKKLVLKNLAMVVSSGKRLANMVNSILDYSRLKTKDLELKTKKVDLNSLAEIVFTMSKPMVSSEKVQLINDIPQGFPLVMADENRLQQILYNLVGNAIKFTEKGSITITTEKKENMAVISVKDTGMGIPEDKKEQIFESYEQLDLNVNREFIGTGLGLTITKNLVELHGGSIWVESSLNKGSAFIFTLPVSDVKPEIIISDLLKQPQSEEIGIKSDVNGKGELKILIVDDEPVNRQVLINHLREENYQLILASGGQEALELIGKESFDLILLDVMMPGTSGYEVCLKIRKEHTLNELPVIFITAKDQIKDLVEGLSYGGNDYITKPFSKQELLARIRTHLKLLKINDSYSRFIPYEFIRSLGRDSIMDVHLGDQIEKEVTILFTDIRDYTMLAEKMSPSENFMFLNSFLSKIGPVIRKNHGFIMHYLGDGLMALFPDDASNAVAASVEIQQALAQFNLAGVQKIPRTVQVGTGMHTGKLILGILGDDERMDANVVSDAVNTASRMEGLTKYYGASSIISEDTLSNIRDRKEMNYRFLGLVRVKGKSNPLKIYELLDGVESETNRLKIELRGIFEKGLDHYFNQEFVEAASLFKEVSRKNPDDLGANKYLRICARLMVDGVDDAWDGVESMATK